jgi:hypothetical protein
MHSARTRTCATNGLFGAFVLALFGAGLIQAMALQARAAALVHVVIAIPCATLLGVLLYRYTRHWPARVTPLYRKKRRGPLPLAAGAALGYGALFLVGIALAAAVAAGSAVLLMLASLVVCILPWSRIPVCRNHFFVSAAFAGMGAVLWLTVSAAPLPPPYYAVGALFCLCTSCLMTVFIILMHGSRHDRMPATGYGWTCD